MKSRQRNLPGALIYKIIACLAPLCCLPAQAFGQAEMPCQALGMVVAQGRDSAPAGELKVRSYRLETPGDKIFFLSVRLDSAINGPYLIWVNDDPKAAYHMRKGELTASFPLQWLEDGAAISISKFSTPYEVTTLPERLRLPESVIRLQRAAPGERTEITSMRRVRRTIGGLAVTFIDIEITKSTPFDPVVANNIWVVQIGRREFGAGVVGNTNRLGYTIREEEFAQLKDGDPVRVNWAFEALPLGQAGKSFAKLDKGMLDRAKLCVAAQPPSNKGMNRTRNQRASHP